MWKVLRYKMENKNALACAKYYSKKKLEILAQKKEYYEKNKEVILQQQKEYREKTRIPIILSDNYRAIHKWARNNVPKPQNSICPICKKKKRLEISNKSGEYKRDIKDYEWICHSCHQKGHRTGKYKNKRFKFDKIKRVWRKK